MQSADGMHTAEGLSCGVSIARQTTGMLLIRTVAFDEDRMLRWRHEVSWARSIRGAQNAFIDLEHLTEEDLVRIKERYAKLAESARAETESARDVDAV